VVVVLVVVAAIKHTRGKGSPYVGPSLKSMSKYSTGRPCLPYPRAQAAVLPRNPIRCHIFFVFETSKISGLSRLVHSWDGRRVGQAS